MHFNFPHIKRRSEIHVLFYFIAQFTIDLLLVYKYTYFGVYVELYLFHEICNRLNTEYMGFFNISKSHLS